MAASTETPRETKSQGEGVKSETRAFALLRTWGPMAVLYGLLTVLVLMPVGILFYAALTDAIPRPGADPGNWTLSNIRSLWGTTSLIAARNSLILGLGGTIVAMLWGGFLAWLSARTDVPWRPLVQMAGIVPMFMSALVGSLAWGFVASPGRSYINLFFEQTGLPFSVNIYSMGGMIFVFGLYYAPFYFLLLNGPLTLMNPELEEAAQVCGASRLRTAREVTFPLITPAILGSMLLTFVLIIENFPVPTLLGTPAGIDTLPSIIYRLMNTPPPRANQAAAVGLLLMAIMVALIWIQRRYISRREYTTVTGKGMTPNRVSLGKWRWPALGVAMLYLLLAVVIPAFTLLQMALRPHSFLGEFGDLFDWSVFDLRHVDAMLGSPVFYRSLQNSVAVGVMTAVLGGLLHLIMAYAVLRSKAPGRKFVEYIAMAPLAMPALVLGLGFLWTWINLPIPIYGTIWVLVAAYIVRFMPQGFQGMSSSMLQIHKDLEESAVVSGATRVRTIREITLPLMRSGAVGTGLLLLILGMRELSAALFLFTARTRVLSIVIFDSWDSGLLAQAAVASIGYSLLLAVIVLIGRRWLGSRTAP